MLNTLAAFVTFLHGGFFTKAARKVGQLDYVVNAAGAVVKHKSDAAFTQTTDWHRIEDINIGGTFFVLRAITRATLK